MALKTCTECGNSVSDTAKTCPNCGVKNPTKVKEGPIIRIFTKFFGWVCIGIIFCIVYAVVGYYFQEKEDQKIQMQSEVVNWINRDDDVKECQLLCKTVKLVKESNNKYIGYASFNNGDQANVDVTVEGDEFLMKANIGLVIAREKLRILNESELICGTVIQQIPGKNALLVRILSSTAACNIPEDNSQKSELMQSLVNVALVNDVYSSNVETGIITFPKDSEELQKTEGEYLFVTAIKDGQHDYIDDNGEKKMINKYRFLETK